MINLLPPAAKRDFTAGRVNALLIRYIWITLALFGLLAALCGLTLIMLEGIKRSAQDQITSSATDVASMADVQQRSDSFRANLATSKAILDQQTHYTDTILKISSLMPAGVVLNNIALDQTTYGTPVSLQIFAKNEQAALNLKKNFQGTESEPTMFSDVHFQSISIGANPDESANKGYPVSAELVVTIKKGGV